MKFQTANFTIITMHVIINVLIFLTCLIYYFCKKPLCKFGDPEICAINSKGDSEGLVTPSIGYGQCINSILCYVLSTAI